MSLLVPFRSLFAYIINFMTHTYCDAPMLRTSVHFLEHIITLLLKRITLTEIEPLKGNIIFYLTISRIVLVTISQLVAILCGSTSASCVGHPSEACGTSQICRILGNKSRGPLTLTTAVNCNFQLITAPPGTLHVPIRRNFN